MLSGYKECPRKYFIRHILGWRAEGTAIPLIFGLSWHNAMDVVWQHARGCPPSEKGTLARLALGAFLDCWEENGLPRELDLEMTERYTPRTPMIAHEMLSNYIDHRWPQLQRAELIACEQPFAVPLPGTDNTWYIGKLDKVFTLDGQGLLGEHKTTTEYKKDGGFKTSYIEGWFMDSQVKGYQFGGGLFFPGHTQVWVDAALVHKTVHNAFRFVPVQHQYPLLQEWISDTREWVRRVQNDTALFRASGKLEPGVFPKNENSCMGKYGPCTFLNICRTITDPSQEPVVPSGYIEERWEPFDVLGLDKLLQGDNGEQTNKADGGATRAD